MSRNPSHRSASVKRARSPSAIASRMGGGRRSLGGAPLPSESAAAAAAASAGNAGTYALEALADNPDPFALYVGLSDLGGRTTAATAAGGEAQGPFTMMAVDEAEQQRALLSTIEAAVLYDPSRMMGGETAAGDGSGGAFYDDGDYFSAAAPAAAHHLLANTHLFGVGASAAAVFLGGAGGGRADLYRRGMDSSSGSSSSYSDSDESEEEASEEGEERAAEGLNPEDDGVGETDDAASEPSRASAIARAAAALFGSSGVAPQSPLSVPSSFSFSFSEGDVLPLTDTALDAIVASARPIALVVCFEGLTSGGRQRWASASPQGAKAILAHIDGCIASRRFFDVSKLELFVSAIAPPKTETNSPQGKAPQRFLTFRASGGGLAGDAKFDATTGTFGPTFAGAPLAPELAYLASNPSLAALLGGPTTSFAAPIAALLRLLSSAANEKLLTDVGDFWAPFLLRVAGSAATRLSRVLDVGACLAACEGLPQCAIVDPLRPAGASDSTTNVFDGAAGAATFDRSTAAAAAYRALALREALWEAPHLPLGTITSSVGAEASSSAASASASSATRHMALYHPILRSMFASSRLYGEVVGDAFPKAPRAPLAVAAQTSTAATSGVDDSAAAVADAPSASSSSLHAAALRESAALYGCALMRHNGLYVDAARAVRLLARLVGRSRQLFAAVEESLLAPLRASLHQQQQGGGGSEVGTTSVATSLVQMPSSDAEVLALINSHWGHFVGPASTGAVIPTAAGPSDLSNPSFLAACPLAAAWAYSKSLRAAGTALQRFLRPLSGDISAAVLRSEAARSIAGETARLEALEDEAKGAAYYANKKESSAAVGNNKKKASGNDVPLPLVDVHPEYHLNSATGRIFARNPNVQTLRAAPMVVTAGAADADRCVSDLILNWRSTFGDGGAPAAVTAPQAEGEAAAAAVVYPPHRPLAVLSVCLRSLFVAPPGTVMLSFDYNQIELRVLAHLSGDPQLLAAFANTNNSSSAAEPAATTESARDNGDEEEGRKTEPHPISDSAAAPDSAAEVRAASSADPSAKASQPTAAAAPQSGDVLRFVAQLMFGLATPLAVTAAQRAQAKVVVYGLLYGMGDKALQQRLDSVVGSTSSSIAGSGSPHTTSLSEYNGGRAVEKASASASSAAPPPPPRRAAELRSLFCAAFPVATEYLRTVGSDAIATRSMATMGGRHRQVSASLLDAMGGTAYLSSSASSSSMFVDQSQFAVRNQAVSMRIQGSAADVLKGALAALTTASSFASGDSSASSSSSNSGPNSNAFAVLMTLHDEIVVVCPDTRRNGGGGAHVIASSQNSQGAGRIRCPLLSRTARHIADAMESQVTTFGMRVPLKVNVKVGRSFGQLKPVEL